MEPYEKVANEFKKFFNGVELQKMFDHKVDIAFLEANVMQQKVS